jgi:hypothetical protein
MNIGDAISKDLMEFNGIAYGYAIQLKLPVCPPNFTSTGLVSQRRRAG